ncbi:MAG: hypothetical protein WDW36_001889 [Sanguina aurantia]
MGPPASGFGTGPRFADNKERGPGPGAYDPKATDSTGYKTDPKILAGERFASTTSIEGMDEYPDISPPRERKVNYMPAGEKKFSWATTRIHELSKELEAAQARLKQQRRGARCGARAAHPSPRSIIDGSAGVRACALQAGGALADNRPWAWIRSDRRRAKILAGGCLGGLRKPSSEASEAAANWMPYCAPSSGPCGGQRPRARGGGHQGQAQLTARHNDRDWRGHGVSTDIVEATALAALEIVNRIEQHTPAMVRVATAQL